MRYLSMVLAIVGCSRHDTAQVSSDVDSRFAAAKAVFAARCSATGCHPTLGLHTEPQLVALGYLTPGAPEESLLWKHLKGADVDGPRDMPKDGSTLSAEELSAVREWIASLGTVTPPTNHSAAALALLRNSCGGCHGAAVTATSPAYAGTVVPAFTAFADDAAFVQSGLVMPGNPGDSWLYQSLKQYGALNLMPAGAGPLAQSDRELLEAWIRGMVGH